MNYSPSDGRWKLSSSATELRKLRRKWTDDEYETQKNAIKEFLCAYFSSDKDCRTRQGDSIIPISSTAKGGKVLKVRWGTPGCGKSGGIRLVVVAYCDELRVEIAEGVARKDSLPDGLIDTSIEDK